MKRTLISTLSLAATLFASAATPTLTVDLASSGKAISPHLFGIFFEDLNYAADGGLYAELVRNRSFEFSPTEQPDWSPYTGWELATRGDGKGRLGIGQSRPIHTNNPSYLILTVDQAGDGVGVSNAGVDTIPVEAGREYRASFWAYQAYMGKMWQTTPEEEKLPMPVSLRLEAKDGSALAEAKVEISGREWRKTEFILRPSRDEDAARLVLLAHERGGLAVDMVSLMPVDTFRGHPNGLRKDIAETIADLKPRFMRFPGGCLVHGHGIHDYYDWKETVGPVEQRRGARNLWGYHQTMGLGYFEFFQFCEDIGALPVPVVTAGVCCQHSGHTPGKGQEGLPMEEMPAYVQDVLDLVEWANGPATSKWGAVRAAAGHPEPFGLRYLGVGNEDAITPEFKERFKLLFDALQRKHPEIVVIGTSGPFPDGEDFDKGWAYARELEVPMVDEHYYRSPDWFWENLHRYDSYKRDGAKVYVGEYAAHEQDRRNTLRTAIAEAAFLTTLERNGDQVTLSSYAPLLARRGHTQWTPDMIYFDATRVYPSLNYTVQKLFGHNAGDTYLPTRMSGAAKDDRLSASTVRDSKTGDIIIKVVNGMNEPRPITLQVGGTNTRTAEKITFGGASADFTNKDGEKPAVMPVHESIRLEPNSMVELPANSLVIWRLRKDP